MLTETLLVTSMYFGLAAGDVYSSRKALQTCSTCVERNTSFNSGKPIPALVIASGFSFIDYKLSKGHNPGWKWGWRFGTALIYAVTIKRTKDLVGR